MFAEDLAFEGPLADAIFAAEPTERMAELWLEPLSDLRRFRRRDRVLRALMLFAAQTYALLDELWSLGEDDDELELPETPPVIAQMVDVLDHHEFTRARFTDLDATADGLVAEAEHWAEQLRLLDEEHAADEPEPGSEASWKLAVRAAVGPAQVLVAGPVAVQVALTTGPQRSWASMWKRTIDALDPLLGRAHPSRDWNPLDGRIVRLGLHRAADPSLGHRRRGDGLGAQRRVPVAGTRPGSRT